MKTIIVASLCFGIVTTCVAQQTIAEYDWSKLAQTGQLLGGTLVMVDAKPALKVVNTNDTSLQVQLFKLVKPAITKKLYAIVGEVKYEDVHGDGYLEMWNYFPPVKPGMPEGAYFSRTLGEGGDLGKITGTSTWRRFMLPFDRTGTTEVPTRLEINLFLPGKATVYIGAVKLVEYAGGFGETHGASVNAWWPTWAAGPIAGISGSILGCIGGLLAWLSANGKARRFVLVSLKLLIALGVLSTATGCLGLSLQQPYGVWLVPLLLGILLLSILPFRLKDYQRRYENLEMRKMVAMDA